MNIVLLSSSSSSPHSPSTVMAQTQTCHEDVDIPSQEKEGVGMREVDDDSIAIVTGGKGAERCHREDTEGKLAGVDGGGGDDGGEE